ncbi:hypothetical protein BC828DRAFT_394741, partial [Blastocladiella britannica]
MDVPRPRWAVLRRWTQGRTALRPAQYIALVAYASTCGSGEALNVLLAWKTRTGRRMFTLEPPPLRGKHRFEAALVHSRITSRADFADWLLTHLDDFLTANVPPTQLLHAISINVPGFLTVLQRLIPFWHADGIKYTNILGTLADMSPPRTRKSLECESMINGKDLMDDLFAAVPTARDPVLLFRAILAALLIGRVDWRPDHPLASSTAVRLDFGPDMTPADGTAALYLFLVQSAGGDTAVAVGLIARFEKMPPTVVRNALVSFAPATTDPTHRNLDLISAILSIDPPSLSTMLEHEAVRLAVYSPSGDCQGSALLASHNK